MIRTRYLVLGLLNRRAMSGYDIARHVDRFRWLISGPSSGSLYPTLHALRKNGLARVKVIPGGSKPPRKLYSITKAGKLKLQEWSSQSLENIEPLRAFLLRLMVAGGLPSSRLVAWLRGRQEQVSEHTARLDSRPVRDDDTVIQGPNLVERYAVAMGKAEVDWLKHTVGELSLGSMDTASTARRTGGPRFGAARMVTRRRA